MSLNSINVKYFKLAVNEIGTETSMDISAKCIICGDSIKNPNKKRLHLYTKNSYDHDMVSCFNCGYKAGMSKFLKECRPDLYNSYRSEMGYNTINKLSDNVLKIKAVKTKSCVKTFDKPNGLIPIEKSVIGLQYLLKRKIKPNNQWYISSGVLKINNKKMNLKDFLIIPLINEYGDWFGFYSRSLKEKYFHTFIPEENQGYKVHNWFKINKEDPVYIFEGIMDELSTNLNAIACLGSDINQDRLQELKEPVFVFDNDTTGIKKSIKYAEMGYKVCVWPKIKQKDCNEMLQTMSKDEITDIIINNTFEGFIAKMKLLLL